MSTDSNKAVVRRFVEEFINQNRPAVAEEIFATDYEGYIPGNREPRRGVAAEQAFTAVWLAAFPDGRVTIEDIIAEGDRVAGRSVFTGTHTGEFMGLPATGRAVTMPIISLFRLRDGKIVENRGEFDQLGLMQQLGVLPG